MSAFSAARLSTPWEGCRAEPDPAQIEAIAAANPAQEVPCFQCGICCVKWQPLMDRGEMERIATGLGMSLRTFRRKYTRRYPLQRGYAIMRAGPQGCVFLRYEGASACCGIYELRPQACRDFVPSLAQPECQEGLALLKRGTAPATSRRER